MTTSERPTPSPTLRRLVAGVLAVLALFFARIAPVVADPADDRGDGARARVLAQIAAVGRRGFLYDVAPPSGDGRRVFLYGTIHVGRAGCEPFNAAVVGALTRSSRIALEADPTDAASTQRIALDLGRYDATDDLRRHVSPALLARVSAFGLANGLAPDRVGRFKPWLLANMVTMKKIGGTGLDPALGSEFHLVGFARGAGLPVEEIEGVETQLRFLATLPDAMQAAQLDEALDEAGDESSGDSRALFDLWLSGDAAAADALVADMHREAAGKLFERYFVETLIDGRNRTMADHVERDLERPGTTFFAVGALHLFGEAGLVRELRRRGYRVTDLQASP